MAFAQYEQNFENLTGNPQGYMLTNQDGFYLPGGVTSVDFKVYTYAGNVLGYPQNPNGGLQFIAGVGPGDGATYARAQRDIDFIFDPGVWTFKMDFACKDIMTGASSNNIGSFSVRSDNTLGLNDYIHLATWVDPNNPTTFNAWYLAYDAGGTQFASPGQSPGAAWNGLSIDHWYTLWTTIDLNSNMITEVGIIDIATGIENTYQPTNWYLDGGAAGGQGYLPVAFRFFAGGGSTNGNSTAWDNMSIEPAGAPPLTGACCVGETCEIHTADECAELGGRYLGDGTNCDSNPCAVAVKSTTWGDIKSRFH